MYFEGFLVLQPCCALDCRSTPGLCVGEHSDIRKGLCGQPCGRGLLLCTRTNMQSFILFFSRMCSSSWLCVRVWWAAAECVVWGDDLAAPATSRSGLHQNTSVTQQQSNSLPQSYAWRSNKRGKWAQPVQPLLVKV